ncbi:MAG: T9SS type A sorting domain-containing protein [Chitinophagales bacterium]
MKTICCLSLIIIGLSAFPVTSAFAQYPEFAPVGATWYYNEYQVFGDLYVKKITSVTETIRFGKNCKQLFSESMEEFYAYRDSLKMYVSYASDTNWHLLYDFTKIAGEVFYAHEAFELADSILVSVISTGDTSINGYLLPFMVTKSIDPFWKFNGKAILNIGSESYFVPPHPIADPFPSGLRCYEDNIIGLYKILSPCDTIIDVGVSNVPVYQGIRIIPNPAENILQVNFDDPTERMKTITVRNVLGSIVMEGIIQPDHRSSFKLDVESLTAGIYLIDIYSEKRHYIERFIRR